ncbi:MAG: cytochrome C peroxidase [Rhizobacter sp.]|nr:cytochrome C peroxidase [Chlorobiales bacterium]
MMKFNAIRILTTARIVAAILVAMAAGCNPAPLEQPPAATEVHRWTLTKVGQLDSAAALLAAAVEIADSNITVSEAAAAQAKVHRAFKVARLIYKEIEFLAEYYQPSTAKEINGPPLDKVKSDDANRTVIPPFGFQAIEEMLFPQIDSARRTEALTEIQVMRAIFTRLRNGFATTTFTDQYIFDAMRLQTARLITLGVSGYDSPAALHSLPEAAASLHALRDAVSLYKTTAAKETTIQIEDLEGRIENAIVFLNQPHTTNESSNKSSNEPHAAFNQFDRLTFITKFVNPVSERLSAVREALKIAPVVSIYQPLSGTAKTLFDGGAFSTVPYSPAYAPRPNPAQAELGRLLFFDPVLSEKNNRACASCHQPQRGFTDGLAHALTASHDRTKLRNTPTLINAGFQQSSSYDQSTTFLEDRVMKVLQSSDEMHTSLTEVAAKLRRSDDYAARFQKTFGVMNAGMNAAAKGEQITEENVKVALAMYVRSLQSFNSPFDQYMRGDTAKLSASERHGFNLFMGKAKCGTCHFMPLFNGTVPPVFTDSEAEVIGVPAGPDTANAEIDSDVGKYALHQIALEKFMFKTPSVRNIALTAPYMHNGVYKTLDEVMDFYNRGGGWGIGIDLPNQTLPAEKLNLSQSEIKDVIAFMHALTDTTGLTAKPTALPRFNDSKLHARKIGGVY